MIVRKLVVLDMIVMLEKNTIVTMITKMMIVDTDMLVTNIVKLKSFIPRNSTTQTLVPVLVPKIATFGVLKVK